MSVDPAYLKRVRSEYRERKRRDKIKLESNGPSYVGLYPFLRAAARRNGYALCIHGSLVRDFDLVCVPWSPKARDPERLLRALMRAVGSTYSEKVFEKKPHGRLARTIHFGGSTMLDVSVMPRIVQNPKNS